MTSNLSHVDQQLHAVIPTLPKFNLSKETLGDVRTLIATLYEPQVVEGVKIEEHKVPGPKDAPEVQIFTYTPTSHELSSKLPAVFWIHAGGNVFGHPAMDHHRVGNLSRELGIVAISVNYRLSPEATFPCGIEDCYAGLKWVHNNADKLGVDVHKIAVAGPSAGGGLSASLALLVRDRAEFKFVAQVLIYPMLDDRSCLRGHVRVGEHIWTLQSNIFAWNALLGDVQIGSDSVSPYAAAMRATSLEGLPPAFIPCGELDLFRDESVVYAQRLWAAGVACDLHIIPKVFHAFEVFAGNSDKAIAMEKDIYQFLKRALF